ncbi:unnamed protein product [Prorocentrum cordatum]|uniref:Cupin-like domain-containing protein n=1 Tax=Prorocentrum cordatum TaxID=2364126 RepID=A0ABN9VNS2_9DINO|nr:unnamed protein product [Polarella glacialis]
MDSLQQPKGGVKPRLGMQSGRRRRRRGGETPPTPPPPVPPAPDRAGRVRTTGSRRLATQVVPGTPAGDAAVPGAAAQAPARRRHPAACGGPHRARSPPSPGAPPLPRSHPGSGGLSWGGPPAAPMRGRRRARLLAPAVAAALVGADAAQPQRPPRVADGATDFGGGSADAPGHGQPMQENGLPQPVDVVTGDVTWEEFWSRYVRANRPVVLRGHAARQRAFGLWTDAYLAERWGSRAISVELNKSEERGGPTTKMAFRDFLHRIYEDENKDSFYAVIDFENDKSALNDFDMPEPVDCKEVVPQSLTLWMSSGGTSSVLHEDDAENFLMLLAGRKHVMLVHQDQARNIYSHIPRQTGTSPVHQDAVDLEVVSSDRNVAVNLWWGHEASGQGVPGPLCASLALSLPALPLCLSLPSGALLNFCVFEFHPEWSLPPPRFLTTFSDGCLGSSSEVCTCSLLSFSGEGKPTRAGPLAFTERPRPVRFLLWARLLNGLARRGGYCGGGFFALYPRFLPVLPLASPRSLSWHCRCSLLSDVHLLTISAPPSPRHLPSDLVGPCFILLRPAQLALGYRTPACVRLLPISDVSSIPRELGS